MRDTHFEPEMQGIDPQHSASLEAQQTFTRITKAATLFRKIRLAAVADAPLEQIAAVADEGIAIARSMATDLDRGAS